MVVLKGFLSSFRDDSYSMVSWQLDQGSYSDLMCENKV